MSRQPDRESLLEIELAGGTARTGQVTVAGTASGVATTETLIAAGQNFLRTVNAFTGIAAITSSGLADEASPPTLTVRARGRDGSPVQADYALATGWPCAIDDQSSRWVDHEGAGRAQSGGPRAVVAWTDLWEPRPGDMFDDDLDRTWEVQAPARQTGTTRAPMWWVRIRRQETGA